MSKWKLLRYTVFAGLIVFAAWEVHPYIHDLISLFQHRGLDYLWIVLAIVVQVLQYVMDGYVLRLLLKMMGYTIALRHTIQIAVLDVFAIHFLPIGSFGSLVAFVYFYRKLGVKTHALVFLNLVSGFAAAVVLAVLFVVSAAALRGATFPIPVQSYVLGAIALLVPALLVLLLAVLESQTFRGRVSQLLLRYHWFASLRSNLDQMRDMPKTIAAQRTKFVLELAAKNFLYHASDMFILLACGLAFHAFIPLFLVAFAYVVSLMIGLVSFLPGGIGTADAILLLIFAAAGVQPSVALGIVLLNRVVSYLLPLALGAGAYLMLRHELRLGQPSAAAQR